jgi:hypothetical protein
MCIANGVVLTTKLSFGIILFTLHRKSEKKKNVHNFMQCKYLTSRVPNWHVVTWGCWEQYVLFHFLQSSYIVYNFLANKLLNFLYGDYFYY